MDPSFCDTPLIDVEAARETCFGVLDKRTAVRLVPAETFLLHRPGQLHKARLLCTIRISTCSRDPVLRAIQALQGSEDFESRVLGFRRFRLVSQGRRGESGLYGFRPWALQDQGTDLPLPHWSQCKGPDQIGLARWIGGLLVLREFGFGDSDFLGFSRFMRV